MISILFSLLLGKLGFGLLLAAALLAAWWFIPEVPWITSRLRKGLLCAAASVAALTIVYGAGAADGVARYRDKMQREISRAIKDGDAGRERALRDFDALPDDSVPDDGFRRP